MQFRPSALSNPNLQRVEGGGLSFPTTRKSEQVEEIVAKVTEKPPEGLPMPVKVAIGIGVAGALGFIVYKLVK